MQVKGIIPLRKINENRVRALFKRNFKGYIDNHEPGKETFACSKETTEKDSSLSLLLREEE